MQIELSQNHEITLFLMVWQKSYRHNKNHTTRNVVKNFVFKQKICQKYDGYSCLDSDIAIEIVNKVWYTLFVNGDGTHNKKTVSHIYNKGMIPIEKNIAVVDEQGNEYEATYPKRAKGLIKNGRARFINENTICLACPPNVELEDKIMSENTVNVNVEVPTEIDTSVSKHNIPYVLEQIEKLHTELQDLKNTVSTIHCITDANRQSITNNPDEEEHEVNCDVVAEVALAKVKATVEVFHYREESLQKLLAFYEKVYDDLQPKSHRESERVTLLKTVIETLGDGMTPIESKEALRDILEVSLQDLSKNI